jgi:hypothetical protein
MSNRACVKTQIKDLNIFKTVCKQHDVNAIEATGSISGRKIALELKDTKSSNYNQAHVVHGKESGTYHMMIDNDTGYSSISKRLGTNGGLIMRDYAVEALKAQSQNSGGMLISRKVNADQSITLQMAF